ncbi:MULTISPECIES: hypothetical protein [Moorena]|nr:MULTISPECIES: hypothetical protein [Moorena]
MMSAISALRSCELSAISYQLKRYAHATGTAMVEKLTPWWL